MIENTKSSAPYVHLWAITYWEVFIGDNKEK